MKDWSGNNKSIWATLGASNHTEQSRESDDYYATSPLAIDKLRGAIDLPTKIWEPCCGEGHLSRRLVELGHEVYSSDLIGRGFGDVANFFDFQSMPHACSCIVTNPPYKYAMECVLHALNLLDNGELCCMFLKTQFLEGEKRHKSLFSVYPPKYVLQFVKRILCAKNGDFEKMIAGGGSAVSFAWFVWEKGFDGETVVKWI